MRVKLGDDPLQPPVILLYRSSDALKILVVILVVISFMTCLAICANICDAQLPDDCWSNSVKAAALGSTVSTNRQTSIIFIEIIASPMIPSWVILSPSVWVPNSLVSVAFSASSRSMMLPPPVVP